jgi:hypothetical protein
VKFAPAIKYQTTLISLLAQSFAKAFDITAVLQTKIEVLGNLIILVLLFVFQIIGSSI